MYEDCDVVGTALDILMSIAEFHSFVLRDYILQDNDNQNEVRREEGRKGGREEGMEGGRDGVREEKRRGEKGKMGQYIGIYNIHGTGLETCHVSALNAYKRSSQSVLREFTPHRCQIAAASIRRP